MRKNCPSYLLCLRIQVEAFSSKYLVFILLQTFASFSCYVCVLCDYKYSSVISKTKVKKGAWHLKYLDFCIFISVILFLDKYSNKFSKTKLQIDAWRWPFVHQNLWFICMVYSVIVFVYKCIFLLDSQINWGKPNYR